MTPLHSANPDHSLPRRLRRAAADLRAQPEAIDLHAIVEAHGGASMAAFLVVLAVPAMIPVPGVPIGAIMSVGIYLIALAMLAGVETVRMPPKLAGVKFSSRNARQILHRLAWLYAWGARRARPRLDWLAGPAARRWLGVFVALMATVIVLPIPLGNIAPGAALVVMALSLLFKDGLGVLFSLGVGILGLGYMVAVGGGAVWLAGVLAA